MNTTFKKLADASFKLGQNLNKQRDTSGQDVGRFSGVAEAVSGAGTGQQAGGGQATNFNPTDLFKMGPITTQYGGTTNIEPTFHRGIDVAVPTGTKIPSTVSGTVVGAQTGVGWTKDKPSYGSYILIKDSSGNYHRFSHLSNTYVPVGKQIKAGEYIGESGFSGSTYSASDPNKPGPHLDYEVFSQNVANMAKKFYNPTSYLASYKE